MPENNAQQTTEVETVSVTPETAREKFEREQQARRQGLRKFGLTPGFLNFAAKPKPQTPTSEPATPGADWKDFERGQVSRRTALRKMGVTSAMTVFALFSVDDLAHMVGKAMEQRAKDDRIAEQVAREFQEAGVVMADGFDPPRPAPDCTPNGSGISVGTYCKGQHPNPTQAICSECCGGVYRNYCSANGDGATGTAAGGTGVNWPFGSACPGLGDNPYGDGATCAATCFGSGYCS